VANPLELVSNAPRDSLQSMSDCNFNALDGHYRSASHEKLALELNDLIAPRNFSGRLFATKSLKNLNAIGVLYMRKRVHKGTFFNKLQKQCDVQELEGLFKTRQEISRFT
jgi:hypothetical protein